MKKYIFLLATFICTSIVAQNIHTGYHSQAYILQSSTNAATMPTSNFVFGIPTLTNISTHTQWPFSLSEALDKRQDDSLAINIPSIISNFGGKDAFYVDNRVSLLHVGFKLGNDKNIFVYFGDEFVSDVNVNFSGDVFDYLTRGNAHVLGQKISFNEEYFDATVYNSFYLGTAVDFNDQLNIGVRFKFLTGLANLHTEKINVAFQTSPDFYQTTLYSDVMVKTSGGGENLKPTKNSGFAVDLGAIYQATDDLELSLALNDIGSINWAEENNEFYTTEGEKEYEFKGIVQSSADDDLDFEDQIDEIVDSLTATMEINEVSESYSTKLKSNLFVGAKYKLTDRHSFSFLFHSKKHPNVSVNSFMAGYQLQLGDSFQLLTSYKNFSGISNVGGGFVWSPGPFQFHMILENMLLEVFDLKNFGMHMGLVLHFGRDD
ncbi:MAG: DUF5723 family protein [Flavobacteriales bacterium]|nr:DUF5723 family protein [Flavobacteriales bacterium]